jgi:CPA2 family monovalent cation:H+ antiporter-2
VRLEILEQILILLAASLPLSLLLRRLGQSTVVGYLCTGLVIGPGGLGLIREGDIHTLAEIGVALLLFTVGIELTFHHLGRAFAVVIAGGALQVGLTATAGGLAIYAATGDAAEGAYLGCALALSSSAIVLKTLADRGELDAPHATGAIGISVAQDLATVPMLVLLPTLRAGVPGGGHAVAIALALGKATLVLGGMWLGSRFLIPPILFLVARARSAEIFIATVMTLVLAAAFGAAAAGLSLAIGAFCAGLLLAESEYSHQIMADVLPFKDVFQAIFFVSVGMLLGPRWVAAHAGLVLGALAVVVVGKALLAGFAARVAGAPARVAAAIGISLAQTGEFSFVLLTIGRGAGAIPEDGYQLALAVSVASMALAAPLIANVRGIVGALARIPLAGRLFAARAEPALARAAAPLEGHVVIAGFGPVGRDVAQFLLDHGIEFVAIELNPRTVAEYRAKGISIYFGDASSRVVLAEAGLTRARALVVAMPDVVAARRAVAIGREIAPGLVLVARTKYRADVESFVRSGADEVVEEEFETALEMVVRLMRALEIPRRVVAERMAGQRLERYRMVPRGRERLRAEVGPLPAFEIEILRVTPESALAGKTIGAAAIRSRTGATVLAIMREEKVFSNPGPDAAIAAYDRLACVGTEPQLVELAKIATPGGFLSKSGRFKKGSGRQPPPAS